MARSSKPLVEGLGEGYSNHHYPIAAGEAVRRLARYRHRTHAPRNIVCNDQWRHVYPPSSEDPAHMRNVSARLILERTGCI